MTAQQRTGSTARRRRVLWGVGALVAAGLVVAALLFQPWLLFVDVRVNDAVPQPRATASSSPATEPGSTTPPTVAPTGTATPMQATAPAGPVDVLSGTFVSHEHTTTGSARVIEFPDGTRQLALEDLDTSNGPDVHVWLSAGPVVEGFEGWFTAASHPHVDLGLMKGNQGDQLYEIPADVDLSVYRAVDLWCERFSVSFGAAALG
ncbi:DM13 domain-containing protein [Microbacterium sp. E-13]|uniref:DM13 domain-containing protein n=1 Tax=Microbacterium sp. E-13 TaxID=3404048 RepID=UPI003CEF7F7A